MNILVCPDKFKGSLTAREVCAAVESALLEIHPELTVRSMPLADGGEGTWSILTEWHGGTEVEVSVQDPLFRPILAHYGISGDGKIAFIEMAEASGLTLLKADERNALLTSSIGTGELMADALDRGVNQIILGIGGSATNDAGIGMASALGYLFYDASGEPLKPIGENLIHLRSIRTGQLHPRLREVNVTALCDVTNPLYGPDGAAHVYGVQKGADGAALDILDAGLRNFRRVVHKQLKVSVDFPGAGAAGGLGAGARAFLNASIRKGVNYIIENTDLEAKVNEADIVITGEGKIDGQTLSGKVVSEIIRLSAQAGKTVYAICGVCEIPSEEILARGVKQVISLVDDKTSPQSAIQHARTHVRSRIQEVFKILPAT